MESINEFVLKYKRQCVVGVILISVLLGLGLMKKTTEILSYKSETEKWDVPSWFNPYGVAAIGFVIAVLMIILINITFRKFVKSLEEN